MATTAQDSSRNGSSGTSPHQSTRPGRPKSGIWKLFEKLDDRSTSSRPDVQCVACKTIKRNAQVDRLIKHILTCKKVSASIKAIWAAEEKKHQLKRIINKDKLGGLTTPRRSRRSSILAASSSPPERLDQNHFALDLANAIHGMGLPFRTVQSEHFKSFMRRYLPQYTLPSRDRIGNDLLGHVYLLERKEVIQHLQNVRYLSVVTDGWTDPNNNDVINFMVVNQRMRPMFWSSVRTGDKRHSAERMSEKLLEVIKEIEDACGPNKVCGIVTDNASVMTKACQLVRASKKSVLYNGCAAHAVNLIIGKLFDSKFPISIFREVLEKAKSVAKFVRKRSALHARFRDHQDHIVPRGEPKRDLSLPVATRWYSSERCIWSVFHNRASLEATFSDSDIFDRFGLGTAKTKEKLQQAQTIVEDEFFWSLAKQVLKLISPISKSLYVLEKDGSCGSVVYEDFCP
ncbi:hypothetical protein AC1031_021932 [Aphanomyces cochlioides]|nr:hypothetical protein AC1031_021932 [Aphanomyces cochlioides]